MLPRSHHTLPGRLRAAAALAIVTALAAGGLLYQTAVRVPRSPQFSRGGAFGGATPTQPHSPTHGAATLRPSDAPGTATPASAPAPVPEDPPSDDEPQPAAPGRVELPPRGTYTYRVEGSERAPGFGSRDYPEEMTPTAHREGAGLERDEIVFDLEFSSRHEEREIVAFRRDAVSFTYEAGSVTFGPMTQSSEASYHPPMTQVPLTLEVGARQTGTTTAKDPDGDVVRTEDWTAKVLRRETIAIAGKDVDTWVVRVDRSTHPGSSEQLVRTRTYWYDPDRSIWVRWHEDLHAERTFGPGTFTYETEYTATLLDVRT